MAIYTNLPIYKATYTLMLTISRMMPDLPRDCRYSIGQDVRRKVMEMIILVYRANRTRQKSGIIQQLRESLLEVQVLIRLMCDMKYISENRYMALVEQTTDMSKQLAAWEKSERYKYSGGQPDNTD